MHSIIYAALNFLKVIKRTFLAFVFCVSRSLKLFMISLLNLCKIKKYFSHFSSVHIIDTHRASAADGGDVEAIVIILIFSGDM